MSRAGPDSEIPEQERSLLNKRLLQTSAPELGQALTYVLHLRSRWKPEGRTKLVVPTSWMQFLTFADAKCGLATCDRRCPFRNVRFESGAETRVVAPDEELPQDMVSQLLTDFGMDGPSDLETFVPLAFEGIPRTRPRSDVPTAMNERLSQSALRRIDFALVPGDGSDDAELNLFPEDHTGCLLLGMKAPSRMQHTDVVSFHSRSGPLPCVTGVSIPEELTSHGQFHLTLLASLIKRKPVGASGTESFPEWFVLFGLVYDARHVRIVAYVPCRRNSDVIGCAAYIVDDLSLHTSVTAASTSTCELALERLRFLLALTTLRRHVHRLSRSLLTTIGSHDGIRRADDPPFLGCSVCDPCNANESEPLDRCASLGSSQDCSSEYSTCASSIPALELDDIPVLECEGALCSSCKSFTSSFCSTCSSLLESASISHSSYSDDSRYTNPSYMELSTISLVQTGNEGVSCLNKLTGTKRWEIIAWAREVIPTEHPVKDTYRMIPVGSQTANPSTCR